MICLVQAMASANQAKDVPPFTLCEQHAVGWRHGYNMCSLMEAPHLSIFESNC